LILIFLKRKSFSFQNKKQKQWKKKFKVHLYGAALGGFLAQIFAQQRCNRVASLILSNAFVKTDTFRSVQPFFGMYQFIIYLFIYMKDWVEKWNNK